MRPLLVVLLFALSAFSTTYRSLDGSGNSLSNPDVGKSVRFFSRFLDAADPTSSTNPRNISNELSFSPTTVLNDYSVNMWETLFGQFVNHDAQRNLLIEDLPSRIVVPVYPGDSLYVINATNNYLLISPSDKVGEFDVLNNATSWFDLSQIYGSDDDISNKLRTFTNGTLKTTTYFVQAGPVSIPVPDMLPSQTSTGITSNNFFTSGPSTIPTAGDDRANENIGLFAISLVFHREHNRLARSLLAGPSVKLANGSVVSFKALTSDSERDYLLFHEARRFNIAQYQKILFKDYPRVVLGRDLPKYKGYEESSAVDTPIEFASAAFRYGHSAIGQYDLRNATTGCVHNYTIPAGVFGPFPITASQLPNAGQLGGPLNPALTLVTVGGLENVLRGLLMQPAERVDLFISDPAIRTVKFAGASGAGVDVHSSDIVRCRENRCPSYYDLRREFYKGAGVKKIYNSPNCQANKNTPVDPLECFLEITSDVVTATKLKALYTKVNRIEAIIGLLAEDREGALLAPTAGRIIEEYYVRARNGDRFYYENGQFSQEQINEIESRTLSDLIEENTGLRGVQSNSFQVPLGFTVAPKC